MSTAAGVRVPQDEGVSVAGRGRETVLPSGHARCSRRGAAGIRQVPIRLKSVLAKTSPPGPCPLPPVLLLLLLLPDVEVELPAPPVPPVPAALLDAALLLGVTPLVDELLPGDILTLVDCTPLQRRAAARQ